MTVKEWKEILNKCDESLEVFVRGKWLDHVASVDVDHLFVGDEDANGDEVCVLFAKESEFDEKAGEIADDEFDAKFCGEEMGGREELWREEYRNERIEELRERARKVVVIQ